MYIISRFPVIVLSTVRTGSTPLLMDLKFDTPTQIFNEPILRHGSTFELMKPEETKIFIKALNTSVKYALKVHVQDLRYYPSKLREILVEHQCHLIRIRRHNVVEQIASYYIETIRKIWGYYKHSQDSLNHLSEVPININHIRLKCAIADILAWNSHLNTVPYTIDTDVWYEDSTFGDTLIKTPKPSNYDELLSTIKGLI